MRTSCRWSAPIRERLAETLPAADLVEIEKAIAVGAARGDRYPAALTSTPGAGN